ncbi:hypothetical protein ACQKWADRAFT_92498 [Trichoderma austrokoningii]
MASRVPCRNPRPGDSYRQRGVTRVDGCSFFLPLVAGGRALQVLWSGDGFGSSSSNLLHAGVSTALIDAPDARGTNLFSLWTQKSGCDGRPRGASSALVSLSAVYWRAGVLAFSGSELVDEQVHWTGTSPGYMLPGTAAGASPDPATRQHQLQMKQISLETRMLDLYVFQMRSKIETSVCVHNKTSRSAGYSATATLPRCMQMPMRKIPLHGEEEKRAAYNRFAQYVNYQLR